MMTADEVKEKFLGKMVFAQETCLAWHPNGQRHLKPTDPVKIVLVSDNGNWVGFECPTKECRSFGNGYQALNPEHLTLVSDVPASVISSSECKCPTLIHGHHFGCVFYKG